MKIKRLLAVALATTMVVTGLAIPKSVSADSSTPVITQIPGTTRSFSSYNSSFLSVTGFAKGHVNDRTSAIGTDKYRVVTTPEELAKALVDARSEKVDVIEIAADLDLGWDALSDEAKSYGSISEYGWSVSVLMSNPSAVQSNVSQVVISNTHGLTIFSRGGNTVHHGEWKLQGTSSDIVIRNITFDGMWFWSEASSSKEAGWSLLKLNGVKGAWIDHCSFTLGYDGNMDTENGASNLTASWCTYSLPADKNPSKNSMLYKTFTYMEELYQKGALASNGQYTNYRKNGASMEEIMAYAAYHWKLCLNGAGDKDFKDAEGLQDGNQRTRLTLAYDKFTSVGSRVPMIRQGTAHLMNCYTDNSGHMALHNDKNLPFGSYGLNRGADARNGASVGADTCVYKETRPMTGSEQHAKGDSNMTDDWSIAFAGTYNHNLVVNSRVTYDGKTYEGSSWDNNGENLLKGDFSWVDKSTIGNWSWFSSIKDADKYTRGTAPKDENGKTISFTMEYSNDPLPYEYQIVPLDEVEQTVDTYAGAYVFNEGPEFWLRTDYSADETFAPDTEETKATGLTLSQEEVSMKIDEYFQLDGYVVPSHADNKELVWKSSDSSIVEVKDSGLLIGKGTGTAQITATTTDGTKISKTIDVTVGRAVESIAIENAPKSLKVGETAQLSVTVKPDDASVKDVTWTSSNPSALYVDEDGMVTALKKATNVRITAKSVDNPKISTNVKISVKEADATPVPTDTPAPTETPNPVTPDPVTPNPTTTPDPVTTYIYGDISMDGNVTAEDALGILKHVVRLQVITDEIPLKLADVNHDTEIGADDALETLKVVVKLKDMETCEL